MFDPIGEAPGSVSPFGNVFGPDGGAKDGTSGFLLLLLFIKI